MKYWTYLMWNIIIDSITYTIFMNLKYQNLNKTPKTNGIEYLHFDDEFERVVLRLYMNNRAHYTKKIHQQFIFLEKAHQLSYWNMSS